MGGIWWIKALRWRSDRKLEYEFEHDYENEHDKTVGYEGLIMLRAGYTLLLLTSLFAASSFAQEAAKAEAPSKKYTEAPVVNGGSIKGRVTFKGEAPKVEFTINQDKQICPHQDGKRVETRIRVGKDGGVGGAVVYLKDITQGKPLAELKSAATLDQHECRYEPFVQIVPFKGSLKVTNSDHVNHNVNARIGSETAFNNAMPNTGWPTKDELTKRMTRPGLIEVKCDVHLWMSAYVWVARHPYYALTADDGSYELKDVPPGEYELVAWHPGYEAKATFDAGGAPTGYTYSAAVEKSAKVGVAGGAATVADFCLNP